MDSNDAIEKSIEKTDLSNANKNDNNNNDDDDLDNSRAAKIRKIEKTENAAVFDKHSVYVLTKADVESGLYELKDVVLPLIGVDTILPENCKKQNLDFFKFE